MVLNKCLKHRLRQGSVSLLLDVCQALYFSEVNPKAMASNVFCLSYIQFFMHPGKMSDF